MINADISNISTADYALLREQICSGDILLCSGKSMFSNLIQLATKSIWSHIAFVIRLDVIDRIMVLESVESIGVRSVPLSSYVKDYNGTGQPYPGKLLMARHNAFKSMDITKLSKNAVDKLGYPYNSEEIARIAARISMKALNINNETIDANQGREFICSEYVYACFKSIGIDIPYDPAGFIAPADFANDSNINAIAFIQTTPITHVETV